MAKEKVASELRRTGELRENEEFRDWPNRQFVSAKFLCDDIIQREDIIRFHKTRRFMPPLQRPVTGVGNLQDQLAQAPATQQFGYTSIREDLPSEFDSYEPHLSLATIWPVLLVTGIEIFIIILMSMVQTAQILGNIDLWLHSGWQPQIRRIWGWLRHFGSFAIPKLRLRLPPRIESGPLMVLSREKGANHGK